MADIVNKRKRSWIMSRVKRKNTGPEIAVRKYLHGAGFRYRLHVATLPGRPDIVFPKYRTVIFVHGCFWHGHPNCKYATIPKSNREFWLQKIANNMRRDKDSVSKLKKMGWKVQIIWQCKVDESNLKRISRKIVGDQK